jgi:hypothetical protein
MGIILVVIGFILLVAGHQTTWLYVGGVAFLMGSLLAERFNFVQTEIEMIIFSITSGVIGSLLVAYLRKFMVVLAAFLSGGYICFFLPEVLGWDTSWINWVVILLVGLASAIMTLVWGALVLILVSTLLGATLIIRNMSLGSIGPMGMFIVLTIFGLVAQWVLWHYSKPDTG